ncbi:hypothetical protein, partial [Dyadobacter sp. 3J3]|uniref:hypothetical protein n=1 Tax=Dyadobacter sp. 3J3 TaxID=2606600 RepID=UPI001E5AD176
NREVKPGTADDTWVKPGKVGSRHNTITINPIFIRDGIFLVYGSLFQITIATLNSFLIYLYRLKYVAKNMTTTSNIIWWWRARLNKMDE